MTFSGFSLEIFSHTANDSESFRDGKKTNFNIKINKDCKVSSNYPYNFQFDLIDCRDPPTIYF